MQNMAKYFIFEQFSGFLHHQTSFKNHLLLFYLLYVRCPFKGLLRPTHAHHHLPKTLFTCTQEIKAIYSMSSTFPKLHFLVVLIFSFSEPALYTSEAGIRKLRYFCILKDLFLVTNLLLRFVSGEQLLSTSTNYPVIPWIWQCLTILLLDPDDICHFQFSTHILRSPPAQNHLKRDMKLSPSKSPKFHFLARQLVRHYSLQIDGGKLVPYNNWAYSWTLCGWMHKFRISSRNNFMGHW